MMKHDGRNDKDNKKSLHEEDLFDILSQIPCGVCKVLLDDDFTLLYADGEFYDSYGIDVETMREQYQNKLRLCMHPDDWRHAYNEVMRALQKNRTSFEYERRSILEGVNYRWVLVRGVFCRSGANTVMICVIIDITVRKTMENIIKSSNDRYRIALKQTNINVWEYDIVRKRLIRSDSSEKMHGFFWTVEDMPNYLVDTGYVHPNSCQPFLKLYASLASGQKQAGADIRFRTQDRLGYWWERISYTVVFDVNGTPVRAIGIGEDITRQKEAEIRYQEELATRDQQLEGIIARSRANLIKNKVDFIQLFAKSKCTVRDDMTYDEMFETGLEMMPNPNDRKCYSDIMSRSALIKLYQRGRISVAHEYRRKDESGRIQWACATVRLEKDVNTGDLYAIGIIRDIDEQKKIEMSLRQRVEKDDLTGAYNQSTAITMMTETIEKAQRQNDKVIMMVFNVDNFSEIVSRSGYIIADNILRELSDLLHSKFPAGTIIGKFYGDEFVVLVRSRILPEQVCAIVDSVKNVISMPYLFRDSEEPVTVSAGILFGGYANTDFKTMYSKACIALGIAKAEGKNRYIVYADYMAASNNKLQASMPPVFSEGGIEHVLLNCALAIVASHNFAHAMDTVLKNIAQYYGSDGAYLVEYGEDGFGEYRSHEWRQRNSAFVYDFPEAVLRELTLKISATTKHNRRLLFDDIVIIKDICPTDYVILKEQNITGLYVGTFTVDDKILGYIGVDNPTKNRGNTDLIDAISYFIANEIIKQNIKNKQEYLRTHDILTGLFNRRSYLEYRSMLKMDAMISMGVVSIDINGLKQINMRFGHAYGDTIIQSIAKTLREKFVDGKVYKFAGDEFLIIYSDITYDAFVNLVEKAKIALDKIHKNIAAVGYAWAESDIHLENLIAHADERMVLAKQDYYNGLDQTTKRNDPSILQELLESLKQGRFKIYLQPKAQISTCDIVGAEALIRYMDNGRVVSPDNFIPQLERGGIIRYLDLFVFEEVLKILEKWRKQGRRKITVSLNFSRSTILYEHLISTMLSIHRKYDVPSEWVEIEITESFGEVEKTELARIGDAIVKHGYRLALDDFGAEYSNISVLAVLQLNVLKLDKSMVNDLFSNIKTKTIVRNFLLTCRELGIESIAEGVETKEQLTVLAELGCDYVQGYYFNKPIPVDTFERIYM